MPRRVFLSDKQQSHVGHKIECQKNDFVHAEKRVEHYVECFSRHGKPLAVLLVHKITGEYQDQECKHQEPEVQYGAPHEESCQHLDIHDVPLFFMFT